MKYLIILILIVFPYTHAQEARTWFTAKGISFHASYVGFESGKVGLKNDTGKTIAISVKNLSIVDRYYLHEKQGIPLEDLEGGNIHNSEIEYTQKASDFKAGDKFKVQGVTLKTLVTPHFLFFYDPSIKIEKMAEILERIWYSHAYRTPSFIDLYGERRKVYFYLDEGKNLTGLRDYYVETLKEELSARDLKALVQRWNYECYRVNLNIPESFIEKYHTHPTGKIQQNESKEEYMESLVRSAPFYKW